MDPRTANKALLKGTIVFEMGQAVNANNELDALSRGRLVDMIIKHRIQARTFLGMSFIHELEVSQNFPFEVQMFPYRNGCGRVKLVFKVKKQKVIMTLNQAPQTEIVY
jgi:hypothetical protein